MSAVCKLYLRIPKFYSSLCVARKMEAKNGHSVPSEKHLGDGSPYGSPEDHDSLATGQNVLHRSLKGRHMQMIAM
jgi:amino acid permease